MDDLFADVAVDYDKMFPRDFDEDGRLLSRLFKRRSVSTVLDCACGTGPHVAMLAGKGFQVTGSDSSAAMLELAHRRRDSEGFKATFVQSEWKDLPLNIDDRFDAVICIGNSLPLAGDDDRVRESVIGMYEMVADGGMLIVQNRNMDKMYLERPDVILNGAEDPGTYTLFIFEYDEPLVIYKIFYLVTGQSHDVTYNEFPMNLLTRAKFEKILREAGASSWRVYGDSYLSPFSPRKSPRMILAAEK